jgi:RNA polymerase sigma-70 factor, ECF subfamily
MPSIQLTDVYEDPDRLHERLVVLRAQAGDRGAFHELVDRYQERLMYYVHRLVQDTQQSRDILQEIWLEVFRALRSLETASAFRVWLYRIAHHRAVSYLRREKVRSDAAEQLARDAETSESDNELELLEKAELVHFALDKLSAVHREVMTLRFLEDMNLGEIAQVMRCNEGTAKSRLHYAKQALRRIIDEEALRE